MCRSCEFSWLFERALHGCAEAEAGHRNGAHEIVLMVDARTEILSGAADGHHQRHEMILLRMRCAGGWRRGPVHQPPSTLGGVDFDQRFFEPAVECPCRRSAAAADSAHVMVARAAADV